MNFSKLGAPRGSNCDLFRTAINAYLSRPSSKKTPPRISNSAVDMVSKFYAFDSIYYIREDIVKNLNSGHFADKDLSRAFSARLAENLEMKAGLTSRYLHCIKTDLALTLQKYQYGRSCIFSDFQSSTGVRIDSSLVQANMVSQPGTRVRHPEVDLLQITPNPKTVRLFDINGGVQTYVVKMQ